MMSGGDSAMMSPVWRTSSAALEAAGEHLEGPCAPTLPGSGASSSAENQSVIADVDHVRQVAQRVRRILPVLRQ